jgi:hypothetical protein
VVPPGPKTQAAHLRDWPGGQKGLPVYPDRASLLLSARDMHLAPGSFAIAEMPPAKLFAWAAGQSRMVALNVFRAPQEPLYVPVEPDEVKALAHGELPEPKKR